MCSRIKHRLASKLMSDVTQILSSIESGDDHAASELLPLVYDELRRLAARKLESEKPGQTLQATALVHEAYMRLVNVDKAQHWNSRGHFFAAAGESMRRILVDNARRKLAVKHGGGKKRVQLGDAAAVIDPDPVELLGVDEVLSKLAEEDQAKADLVKLRYFAGFTIEEAADVLGISRTTASRYWTYARAWLYSALKEEDS